MGLFRRAVDAVNYFDFGTDVIGRLDPTNRRTSRLEERGVHANGVITGIHFFLSGDVTRREYAITVVDPASAQARLRLGVRAALADGHRLRLGVPVVVRADGKHGVLDWDVMRRAWGLADRPFVQDSIRSAPDDGLRDDALPSRVRKRLEKWEPVEATVVGHSRRYALGMPTLNWDVQLELPDGTRALCGRDEVPTYAQWYTAPGAVVPAVVDPKDRTQAAVNWPLLAGRNATVADFDDDPPAGSIAAVVEAESGAEAVTAMSSAAPAPVDPDAPVSLDVTMSGWVDARRDGYLSEKEFEKALRDWQASGMCTTAQVDLARRSAAGG